MPEFAGLTPIQAEQVRASIVDTMASPRWNVGLISQRVRALLEVHGIPNASARADLIARTESAAIVSEYRVRQYQAQEAMRGREFLYRDAGVDDHRRTKLSKWIQERVGEGKPLREVISIIEEGISLAKAGAFSATGALRGVQGQSIVLPHGFRRRGLIAHFGERDTFVRVVK